MLIYRTLRYFTLTFCAKWSDELFMISKTFLFFNCKFTIKALEPSATCHLKDDFHFLKQWQCECSASSAKKAARVFNPSNIQDMTRHFFSNMHMCQCKGNMVTLVVILQFLFLLKIFSYRLKRVKLLPSDIQGNCYIYVRCCIDFKSDIWNCF